METKLWIICTEKAAFCRSEEKAIGFFLGVKEKVIVSVARKIIS
jgi:hypothetical protein